VAVASACPEATDASIDTRARVEPEQFPDVVGGYNRFDVFTLTIDRRRRPATFAETGPRSPIAEVADPAAPPLGESAASD
jgi:aliphatic nitrilase